MVHYVHRERSRLNQWRQAKNVRGAKVQHVIDLQESSRNMLKLKRRKVAWHGMHVLGLINLHRRGGKVGFVDCAVFQCRRLYEVGLCRVDEMRPLPSLP